MGSLAGNRCPMARSQALVTPCRPV